MAKAMLPAALPAAQLNYCGSKMMKTSSALTRRTLLGSLAMATAGTLETRPTHALAAEDGQGDKPLVQAQKVITVSEGKRLIAKGIVRMPVVQNALKRGIVIICKGTTTTYIAQEILKTDIPHGAFVIGRVYPEKGGKRLPSSRPIGEIVIVDGQYRKDLPLDEAIKKLKAGDVVLKGANALCYQRRLAAGLLGVPSAGAGTSGKTIPATAGTKAHFIIPVGMEKEVGGDIVEIVRAMQTPAATLGDDVSMVLYTGMIFTEIEALHTLTGVSALHVASGGIGGAEGAVRLLLRGSRRQVELTLETIAGIQGEPPFVS
jgi:hypothetical protein